MSARHTVLAILLSMVALTGHASGRVSQPDPLPRAITVDPAELPTLDAVIFSADFVDRVLHDLPVDHHLSRFRDLNPEALADSLNTQARQLAFWLNVYNGYTQFFLKSDPSTYLNDRRRYFRQDQIHIAGERVSLEDVEHGVLRRGATIYSLGHLRLLFPRRAFVRRFAVETVDYRLHFALNCGARSCPPVLPYTEAAVDDQLDAISRFYLAKEARYEPDANRIQVPRLMRWFSADFGGGSARAKRAILVRHGVLPDGVQPRIEYRGYDWTLLIGNYAYYHAEPGPVSFSR